MKPGAGRLAPERWADRFLKEDCTGGEVHPDLVSALLRRYGRALARSIGDNPETLKGATQFVYGHACGRRDAANDVRRLLQPARTSKRKG
jgi:hypothetical protein